MSRLADDIALLQRAADTAGLVLYPGAGNRTFPSGNLTAGGATLTILAVELENRMGASVEYRVIDYPALWLMQAARQLQLHQADDNEAMAARYQKLGEAMRAAVEVDLVNARKTNGETI